MDLVKFILAPQGLLIAHQKKDSTLYLQTDVVELAEGEACWMSWKHKAQKIDNSDLWVLEPTAGQDNFPFFRIEKPYGENRPRMTALNKNLTVSSQLKATTLEKDGYDNDEQSVWTIKKE